MPKKKKKKFQANQFTVDPRQLLFIEYYFDPKSKTFSDALHSALKAGYRREYAESITHKMPEWLADEVGRLNMLRKAERNLNEFLDMNIEEQAMGAFGPITVKGKPMMRRNAKILAVKHDATKFVAERLNKKTYAARTEHTGKDGEKLFTPDVDEKQKQRIKELL